MKERKGPFRKSLTKAIPPVILVATMLAITTTGCSSTPSQESSKIGQLQKGQRDLRNDVQALAAEVQQLNRDLSSGSQIDTQSSPAQIIEKEVPVEFEVIKEVEVLREVEVPVEVERIIEVEKVVEVPVEVERIVEVEVPVEVIKEVPVVTGQVVETVVETEVKAERQVVIEKEVPLEGGDISLLRCEVIETGTGALASPGDTAVVDYTGWLLDGTRFDSSVDRGQPFEFVIGAGGVIKGWEEALVLMKVGDKWKVTIPPELAYDERSVENGLIPPNSTLVFEIELLELK